MPLLNDALANLPRSSSLPVMPITGGEEIAGQYVATQVRAVSRAVAAQPVVLRELGFDREGARVAELLLEEEVAVVGLVAVLYLSRGPDSKKVLVAIIRAVQVV